MKPLVLATILFTVCVPALAAGDIFIPDASAANGTSVAIPWGQTEIRYQAFVGAARMGGKPFRIRELSFAPAVLRTFTATQLEIRMAHVTVARLSRVFAANLQKNPTTVYAGPFTWKTVKDRWTPVGLKSTFAYNGTDNLVIEIRFKGGQGKIGCHSGRVATIFVSGPGSYTARQSGLLQLFHAPKMRITFDATVLNGSGNPTPGGAVDFALESTADAGLPYQLGTSLGTGPIPIDTRHLHLSPDALLAASVSGTLPMIFARYAGYLDAQGKARAKLAIPNLPALKGLRLHSAYLTLKASAPSGVANISNTFSFSIT